MNNMKEIRKEEKEEILIDSYEPDYEHKCEICGAIPVVTAVKDGIVVMRTDMCGPCTWGEAITIDPEEWNK